MCLQEVKWKGQIACELGDGYKLFLQWWQHQQKRIWYHPRW
jgi:hypothetical protein